MIAMESIFVWTFSGVCEAVVYGLVALAFLGFGLIWLANKTCQLVAKLFKRNKK